MEFGNGQEEEDDEEEEEEMPLLSPREELEIKRYRTESSISMDDLKECCRTSADIWKERNRTRYMPFGEEYHDCSSSCSLEPLEFKVFEFDPSVVGPTGTSRGDDSNEQLLSRKNAHVCVKGMCRYATGPRNASFHRSELLSFSELYVCALTGLTHACGTFCDSTGPNGEGLNVCRLTNKGALSDPQIMPVFHSRYNRLRQDSDTRMNNPFLEMGRNFRGSWKNGNRFRAYRSPSKDLDMETAMLNSEGLSESDVLCEFIDPTRKRGVPSSKFCDVKEDHLKFAFLKLLRLFSQERFDKELKFNERITWTISLQLEKYVNKTEQLGISRNATDMYTIASNGRNESNAFPAVRLDPNRRRGLAIFYAHRCLAFYVIVRSKTEMGRADRKKFPFSEFVIAAMQLFQTGFHIKKDAANAYDVIVIEKDELLDAIPITDDTLSTDPGQDGYAERTNSVSHHPPVFHPSNGEGTKKNKKEKEEEERNNRRRRRNNNNNNNKRLKYCVKRNIEEALYSAVVIEGVSPELLKPSDVGYETMDETVFFNDRVAGVRYGKKKRKRSSSPPNIDSSDEKSTETEFLSIVNKRIIFA